MRHDLFHNEISLKEFYAIQNDLKINKINKIKIKYSNAKRQKTKEKKPMRRKADNKKHKKVTTLPSSKFIIGYVNKQGY